VHVFFRYPAEKEIRNSAGWLGPGLDVRGEGGYVVVPPSRTRGVYEWMERAPPAEAVLLLGHLGEENEGRLF
jgi:Bifunctional DNA primase/polymerase, N-terminal